MSSPTPFEFLLVSNNYKTLCAVTEGPRRKRSPEKESLLGPTVKGCRELSFNFFVAKDKKICKPGLRTARGFLLDRSHHIDISAGLDFTIPAYLSVVSRPAALLNGEGERGLSNEGRSFVGR